MSNRPTDAQLVALRGFGAATVHEAQGGAGALDSAIKPLDPAMVLAGPALTVDSRPADNLAIQHAVTLAQPGDVLVVDAKAFTEAGPWGELLTIYAQRMGVAGLVIDGSVRDSRAIVELGFPVFARGVSVGGTGKHQPGAVNAPIICGGVAVRPGDVVVADADGVVLVPAGDVGLVHKLAEERHQGETRYRAAIRDGKSLVELLGLTERIGALGYLREDQ